MPLEGRAFQAALESGPVQDPASDSDGQPFFATAHPGFRRVIFKHRDSPQGHERLTHQCFSLRLPCSHPSDGCDTRQRFDRAGHVGRTPWLYRICSDGLQTDNFRNQFQLPPLSRGVTILAIRAQRSGRFRGLWPQRRVGEKDSFHSF